MHCGNVSKRREARGALGCLQDWLLLLRKVGPAPLPQLWRRGAGHCVEASRLLVRLVRGSGAPASSSSAGWRGIVCLLSLSSPLPGAVMLALHRFPYLWQ